MHVSSFKLYIHELFGDWLSCFQEGEEYGYYNFTSRSIKKIGYSTNITPEIIEQAAVSKVDLIITHHDAWDFVYGMKEACMTLLEKYNIAHFFVHLPLDYVEFGTCISLLRELDADRIVKHSTHQHGSSTVAVGELSSELLFQELVERVSSVLKEPVFALQCNRRSMKRIGMITGAGHSTDQLKEATHYHCDVYITGEKSLYTVQYAKFLNLNLIVGSHTFTEVYGVQALAIKLKEKCIDIEIVQLEEKHLEAEGITLL